MTFLNPKFNQIFHKIGKFRPFFGHKNLPYTVKGAMACFNNIGLPEVTRMESLNDSSSMMPLKVNSQIYLFNPPYKTENCENLVFLISSLWIACTFRDFILYPGYAAC